MPRDVMLLYGKNSVYERLRVNSPSIKKIFLQKNFTSPHIEELANKNNIPVERLPSEKLSRIKHAKDLQGIVSQVEKFKYTSFDELLDRAEDNPLTLIFLDRINDPQNLGVIIRILACFGDSALVIPGFRACEVTEAVLHVAQGGENYVPVSMVSNLSRAIVLAKKSGYWIMGAVVDNDARDLGRIDFPFPLGLVLGSEGEGVRYGIQKHLDIKAHIPMYGAKLSFNVSMACAIFCYEISKQKRLSNETKGVS